MCCHQGLVAIASSDEAFYLRDPGDGPEVKTTKPEKSYKESLGDLALLLKHRQATNCGGRIESIGPIKPISPIGPIRVRFQLAQLQKQHEVLLWVATVIVVHILREKSVRGRLNQ